MILFDNKAKLNESMITSKREKKIQSLIINK
jgi:hypothetical protein